MGEASVRGLPIYRPSNRTSITMLKAENKNAHTPVAATAILC